MTTREIELRLKLIRSLSEDDPKAATVEQMKLYEDFIRYVSTLDIEGTLPGKAALVNTARDITFARSL